MRWRTVWDIVIEESRCRRRMNSRWFKDSSSSNFLKSIMHSWCGAKRISLRRKVNASSVSEDQKVWLPLWMSNRLSNARAAERTIGDMPCWDVIEDSLTSFIDVTVLPSLWLASFRRKIIRSSTWEKDVSTHSATTCNKLSSMNVASVSMRMSISKSESLRMYSSSPGSVWLTSLSRWCFRT